jgi:hypothetical protein
MAKKPDTPCTGCGKLLWSGPRSRPDGERLCRECRSAAGSGEWPPLAAPESSAEPHAGFGPRGARLWRDMGADKAGFSPAELVLLEEACRLADRLDRLDDFLCGRQDAWLRFHARNEDGTIVRVVVDRALSEARQQADTLRSIVADLLKKAGGRVSEEPAKESILDELARRRTDRQQAASGP